MLDEEANDSLEEVAQRGDRRRNGEESENRQQHADDTAGVVVDEHLEAGLDLACPELVDLLHDPRGTGAHDHRAEEHRDAGADNDTNGRDCSDYSTTHSVDHAATGVGDEQREQVRDHRPDKAEVGYIGILAPASEELDPFRIHAEARQPAGRDEERGDETPGDEGCDVGQDHVADEGSKFLDTNSSTSARLRYRRRCH